MARRLLLRTGVAEQLLATKLQILNGTGTSRTSTALSILTGRGCDYLSVVAHLPAVETIEEPMVHVAQHQGRQYARHTVYLSERHMGDIDWVAETCQPFESKRVSRSAVLRRAVEFLRAAVEADPSKSILEND